MEGFQTTGCCSDAFGQVWLDWGDYDLELVQHEAAGAAYIGLWAAQGKWSSYDNNSARYFSLVGANLPAGAPPALVAAPVRQAGTPVRPLNDDFADSFPLFGMSASADTCSNGATRETGELLASSRDHTLWWSWTAPASDVVRVDATGSDFAVDLDVRMGTTVTSLNVAPVVADRNVGWQIFSAVAGTTYRIQVFSPSTGRIHLTLGPPAVPLLFPPNDNFDLAQVLSSGGAVSATGSTRLAYGEIGEPPPPVPVVFASNRGKVWYSWTAPWTGEFVLDTQGSRFRAVMAVYTGSSLASLRLNGADWTNSGGAFHPARLVLPASAGVTYSIAIEGVYGERGDYVLNIIPVPMVTRFALDHVTTGDRYWDLDWRSETGARYIIESSTDLITWLPESACTGGNGTTTRAVLGPYQAKSDLKRYFRVSRQ